MRAAVRNEFEQSRRLKTSLKEIRDSIRDCWDRSGDGQGFAIALEEKGFKLARGDSRDFMIVGHAGGVHALSKRIIGATARQTRDRLANLSRAKLPTVEAARAQLQYDCAVPEVERSFDQRADQLLVQTEGRQCLDFPRRSF